MDQIEILNHRYRFSGHELVYHDVNADQPLPGLLARLGYERVFIVCSRSLNTTTPVVKKIKEILGESVVGMSDNVGEHSPLRNILAAARAIRDSKADVIISIGGGSVLDMCKAIQLCISENVYERGELLKFQLTLSEDGTEMLTASKAPPSIRQIAIPTTLSTSEWTPVTTPIDEDTSLKARFLVPSGSPVSIIYDPAILAQTPSRLLLSTGIRGLDHAINTVCAASPHPFATMLAERAIKLFMENLLLLRDPENRQAFANCQLAAWYTGMGQMSVAHGFSHWMVHIIGPYGSVPHSDAGCVLMLAQARWLEGWAVKQHERISRLVAGENLPFYEILKGFLLRLSMPVYLDDLGLTRSQVEEMINPALQHPMVTKNNLRPIQNEADLRAILELAWRID